MPWFMWVIIWVLLVLGLLGMLTFFAFRLFRKAMITLGELEKLGEQIARVQDNVEQLSAPPSQNAILVGYPVVSRQRDTHNQLRDDKKQLRRLKALERGKLLIRTDYRNRTWPHAR
ncbi:hypothetical protein [Subtercola frigoramans]|uniref:DUF948 domain-containing protein n=1 Tax=Subtercola frigoramans TaxID=120298 RepID=A0ABS2L5X2_9MICO|nr:hypothetical protein [Subtercola frigoramans]MBM7472296.1 hypothetical protein [Subtercola frigoramans]